MASVVNVLAEHFKAHGMFSVGGTVVEMAEGHTSDAYVLVLNDGYSMLIIGHGTADASILHTPVDVSEIPQTPVSAYRICRFLKYIRDFVGEDNIVDCLTVQLDDPDSIAKLEEFFR